MDMQALLAEIELDMQELKYLTEAYMREANASLRGVLRRNIWQMRGRLDEMLQLLDNVTQVVESNPVEIKKMVVDEQIMVDEKVSEKETIKEKTETSVVVSSILGERIKLTDSLRHSISLNDSFRFSREIFGGDSGLMNQVVEQISAMNSLETALAYLSSKVSVDEENEAMVDFQELLKKYFN